MASPAGPPVTLALPKGRILVEALRLFARAGYDLSAVEHPGRRLIFDLPGDGLRVILVKDTDVPTYIDYGAADAGIAGRDVIEEQGFDLYEPLDLGIGRCTVIVARPKGAAPLPRGIAPRVATKYLSLAAHHFARKGLPAEIIPLHGSIEVAPSLGLADVIVDITETGETLRANGLVVEEEVLAVSARLVVNRVALKLHAERIRRVIEALREAVAEAPGADGR